MIEEKKIIGVYEEIISKKNLYRAVYNAARGKRYNGSVSDFLFYQERNINDLHSCLLSGAYRHGKYNNFLITDPKRRQISAAPFRDRVVHHAVHDVIEPLIDRSFIHDSYACRKDKGTHKALDRAQKFLRANKFCFHGDIRKYFSSINHEILKELLREKITDVDLLSLLDKIIDSANQAVDEKGVGLPIGNLTSQFFANLYLNELDYFVKHFLRCRYYLRYMDDFLIFDNDKRYLKSIKGKVRNFLNEKLKLGLHEGKSQVYLCEQGVKFLGFRLYPFYRRLTSENVRRFKKRIKNFEVLLAKKAVSRDFVKASLKCWTAHSMYASTYKLRERIVKEVIKRDSRLFGDCAGYILPYLNQQPSDHPGWSTLLC
ncbi:MAG: reverse transcriptase/maturase family protein [Candidatus Omnitrophota bacterium]